MINLFIKRILILVFVFFLSVSHQDNIVQAAEGHVVDCSKYNVIRFNKALKKNIEVTEVQKWLKENGYYKGKIDGLYGKKTINGIKKFQKDNKIIVDGIIGCQTWHKIGDFKVFSNSYKDIRIPNGRNKVFVNLIDKNLFLIVNDLPFKKFKVATGKLETPTPIGKWFIKRKAENWGTGFGSRWIGLNVNWGLYGIHGTNKPWSVGKAASHGCIRMNNRDIENLYKHINVGDKVNIFGNPFGVLHKPLRVLMKGEKGTDVIEIQKQLKRLGYYKEQIDGIFGATLEKSVKEFQKDMKVEVTAQIREKEYQRLGFGNVLEVRERKN